jgi:hypothetical protein
MTFLKGLATLISLAIAGVGLMALIAPDSLLDLARWLLAPPALYGVAAMRVLFGVLLLVIASHSRAPVLLRVFAVLILVAGIVTPFIGVDQTAGALAWFSGHAGSLRALAIVPIAMGVGFAYAINARR